MPPLKLAIIGGGPSAFYLTSRLLHLLPTTSEMRIHVYDRLWAPYGLVRYGVAPDHPEVKNCTHKFDVAASDPRVRFFGNVNVGLRPTPFPSTGTGRVDKSEVQTGATAPLQPHALLLPLHVLFPYYTHLVFATGAPHPRLHPLLPRSEVCIPALDIVHWYTMHPSTPSISTFRSPIPSGTRHITIIGHGNVSLDIARILLTPPSRLASLDIPAHVLRVLEDIWGTLRQVRIVGRRGPREVRFTAKELREMMHLEEANMWAIPEGIMSAAEEGGGVSRQQGRIMKLLKEGSKKGGATEKTFGIDFWRSPTGYTVLPPSEDARVELQLEEMQLDRVTKRAVGTGKYESVRTDLIVTSLGYEGDAALVGGDGDAKTVSPTDGTSLTQVQRAHSQAVSASGSLPWYDASTGRIRTQDGGGRVLTPERRVVPNVYTAGWAGRGASGVLTGTLLDANDVAAAIVEDWGKGGEKDLGPLANAKDVAGGLEGVPPVVTTGVQEGQVMVYGTWRKVEEEERERGGGVKERERMRWADVVKYLNQGGRMG